MSENEYTDPSGNTAQFQAFVSRPEQPAPPKRSPLLLIAGIAIAIVVIAVVAYLLVS